MTTRKMRVGSLETCDLPELGIEKLQMRIDTGAATSSLHVDNIEEFRKNGKRWVSFDFHPDAHDVDRVIRKTARVTGRRSVKNSSADTEKRVVISTTIRMGGQEWSIQLNLTDRSGMTYLMLLGREAMAGRLIVDPEFDYLLEDVEIFDDEFIDDDSEE